ncbi:MAG: transposase [Tabrizicola sp.]|jgi:transposase|nr:transposase [Tabrizicola sp.]
MACASVVSPIEIFAADEVGRRRRWSDEDKIRIVEESLRGYRQGSATARRYGISRSLLSIWRREYRGGTLGTPEAGGGFVPLVMESAPLAPEDRPSREADDARIDITLTNGRRMTIPASLAPSHLAALLAVLDPR